MQTLKDTVLELREIIFGEHNIEIEGYAEELSKRSPLNFDEIKNIYNNLSLIYINSKNTNPRLNYSKKKIWESCEDQFMLYYVNLAIKNGMNKSMAIKDLCDILVDRTKEAVSFRFYNRINSSSRKVKRQKTESKQISSDTVVKNSKSKKDEDLLDMVVDIVDNVDTAGIDVTALFKGILTLSRKAVDNSNVGELEELEGKVGFLELELDNEKKKNDLLQSEVANLVSEFEKLRNEIEYFDGLNGKQKLQQLNSFNRNLKVMVDKFGGVLAVGYAG